MAFRTYALIGNYESLLLAVLFILAAFVIVTSVVLWQIHGREMVLEAQLVQESLQIKEIEEKNRALETEIKISKSLEENLRESEEKFKSISTAAQDAVVMINNEGCISFWNPAAEKIFGYSETEVMDKAYHLVMMPEKYHDRLKADYAVFSKTGTGDAVGKTVEINARKKQGDIFPVEMSLSAFKIKGKWNALAILRDISDRKKTEQVLSAHRENLKSLVKERTLELEHAQKELINKAVDAGRVQLSAMVLHNIGNAVTPVSVRTEQLKPHKFKEISRYLKKCYHELVEHKNDLTNYVMKDERGIQVAQYLLSLMDELEKNSLKLEKSVGSISKGIEYISEILSLQREYAPSTTQMKEKINLNELIRDVLKIQESSILKRKIKVSQNLSADLPRISIEKNKLMQVLVNFVKNSCDAIDENREAKKHRLDIFTYWEQDGIVVKIVDTGCGVPPEKINTIFNFGTSSKGSSGFGLYYCKSFIEANNGILTLESDGIGQGATVSMMFSRESSHAEGLKLDFE